MPFDTAEVAEVEELTYSGEEFEDGNALAGPLAEIFAVDLTAATGRCVNCGLAGPVAALRVYPRGPGLVARCPRCGAVVMRLVHGPDATWLDLRGTVHLRIPMPREF